MADAVKLGEGWRVSPAAYIEARPAAFGVGRPSSHYVRMRDGCRLAIDVYLPQAGPAAPGSELATILIFTPYYRRFRLTARRAGRHRGQPQRR